MTHDAENPFAGQGAVVLDIGGDVGALVVTMPEGRLGDEIEIRPVGVAASHAHGAGHGHGHDEEHLLHVAVVDRPVAEGHVPSLVFPELVEGRYELFPKGHGDQVALSIEIVGGEVTEADWPV